MENKRFLIQITSRLMSSFKFPIINFRYQNYLHSQSSLCFGKNLISPGGWDFIIPPSQHTLLWLCQGSWVRSGLWFRDIDVVLCSLAFCPELSSRTRSLFYPLHSQAPAAKETVTLPPKSFTSGIRWQISPQERLQVTWLHQKDLYMS